MSARFFIDPKRFLRGLVRMKFIEPEDVVIRQPKVLNQTRKALVQHDGDELAKKRANGTAKKRCKSYGVDV